MAYNVKYTGSEIDALLDKINSYPVINSTSNGKTLQAGSSTATWNTVYGLPTGGTANQVLVKSSATNGSAQWVTKVASATAADSAATLSATLPISKGGTGGTSQATALLSLGIYPVGSVFTSTVEKAEATLATQFGGTWTCLNHASSSHTADRSSSNPSVAEMIGVVFGIPNPVVKYQWPNGQWLRVYEHIVDGTNTQLFTSLSEAQNCNTETKYSCLGILELSSFWPYIKDGLGYIEYMHECYPWLASATSNTGQTREVRNRWIQQSPPSATAVVGYRPSNISWNTVAGLKQNTNTAPTSFFGLDSGTNQRGNLIAPKAFADTANNSVLGPGNGKLVYGSVTLWVKLNDMEPGTKLYNQLQAAFQTQAGYSKIYRYKRIA